MVFFFNPVTFGLLFIFRFGLAALTGDRETFQHPQGFGCSAVASSLPRGAVTNELPLTHFQQNVEWAWWSAIVVPASGTRCSEGHGVTLADAVALSLFFVCKQCEQTAYPIKFMNSSFKHLGS